MARVPLEIPKIGLVMEHARLVRWLKSVGDRVTQGEPLLELETEKSVVEIEATADGRLVEILLQPDQQASVGDRVGWLEDDTQPSVAASPTVSEPATSEAAARAPATSAPHTAPVASLPAAAAATATTAAATGHAGHVAALPAAAATGHAVPAAAATTAAATGHAAPAAAATTAAATGHAAAAAATADATGHAARHRVRSSPAARRLAAEHSLDLRQIAPTGPRGRLQLSDVRSAIQAGSAGAPAAKQVTPAAQQAAPGVRSSNTPGAQLSNTAAHPLTNMRRAVARAMTLSNATVPQFIVERSVDWSTVQELRGTASINDFLLRSIGRALQDIPDLNATFQGDPNTASAELIKTPGTHIGLVVAVEGGVIVPVLHDVHQLGIDEIARRRADLVKRALSGKLKREELEGATISISNLGARGPDRFTAMISPPQSAILAVGRRRDCAVIHNGGIHVRPLSQLTLTVDHRVADGRLASDFLGRIVDLLEGTNP